MMPAIYVGFMGFFFFPVFKNKISTLALKLKISLKSFILSTQNSKLHISVVYLHKFI